LVAMGDRGRRERARVRRANVAGTAEVGEPKAQYEPDRDQQLHAKLQ